MKPTLPTDTAQNQVKECSPGDLLGALAGARTVIAAGDGLQLLHLRKGMRRAGVNVVGVVALVAEAVTRALSDHADIVVLDSDLRDSAVIALVHSLSCARPEACVVLLTAYSTDTLRLEAASAGTCGIIEKPYSTTTLIPQLSCIYEFFQRQLAAIGNLQ